MGNFTIVLPYNHVNGTIADANEVNANHYALRDGHNSSMHGTTGHGHTGATGDGPKLTLSSINLPELAPIGSIIDWYDFNGTLTFDPTKWAYMNGQSKVVGAAGLQVLTDMSNRYCVGFGTEGGGDIGTAVFSVVPVGNASHLINIQHSHTVNAHHHAQGSHSHTVNAHNHSINLNTGAVPTGGTASRFQIDTVGFNLDLGIVVGSEGDHIHPISGNTGNASPGTDNVNLGNTSDTSPGTDSQLSAVQSIQPRSIRTRKIMRIA